jgi:hypothetical protein
MLPMPPGRPSHRGSIATSISCRTLSTTSYPTGRRINSRPTLKKDIPRMEMVHHQDVMVELSTRLLVAQREIETLHIQLRNADATIRGYMRMVEGQASDLYASDTDTWTVTSSIQSLGKEPAVSSHSPSRSRSH